MDMLQIRFAEPADPPAVVRSLLDGTLGGPSIRFVPAMTGRYRLLDHLAQFNETDLAFLSRLAERYGISFRRRSTRRATRRARSAATSPRSRSAPTPASSSA